MSLGALRTQRFQHKHPHPSPTIKLIIYHLSEIKRIIFHTNIVRNSMWNESPTN